MHYPEFSHSENYRVSKLYDWSKDLRNFAFMEFSGELNTELREQLLKASDIISEARITYVHELKSVE